MDEAQLRARVIDERRRRGLSVRQASQMAGISNTMWGEWERGVRPLTGKLRTAVASVFDWDGGWPENVPAPTEVVVIDLDARLDRIEQAISRLAGLPDAVAELGQSIHVLLSSDVEEEQLQGERPADRSRRSGSST